MPKVRVASTARRSAMVPDGGRTTKGTVPTKDSEKSEFAARRSPQPEAPAGPRGQVRTPG